MGTGRRDQLRSHRGTFVARTSAGGVIARLRYACATHSRLDRFQGSRPHRRPSLRASGNIRSERPRTGGAACCCSSERFHLVKHAKLKLPRSQFDPLLRWTSICQTGAKKSKPSHQPRFCKPLRQRDRGHQVLDAHLDQGEGSQTARHCRPGETALRLL